MRRRSATLPMNRTNKIATEIEDPEEDGKGGAYAARF
jgi:hypothetical protein